MKMCTGKRRRAGPPADSRSGISGGSLNEAGALGVGGGSIVGSGGASGLGYAELGEIPGVGNAGVVGFGGTDGGGVGGYGEGEFLGREAGGGSDRRAQYLPLAFQGG